MPDAAPRTQPHPACPLCSRDGRIVHPSLRDRAHGTGGEWSMRDCLSCGVGWLDPQPIDEDIGLCYPGAYYTHQDGPPSIRPIQGAPGLQSKIRDVVLAGRFGYQVPGVGSAAKWAGRMLGLLEPVRYRMAYSKDRSLPPWREGGRLLDIGCGPGRYLDFARSLGWQTYGLDPDPVAAGIAQRSGATVVVGTLDTAVFADAPFDAVASMHSIEHARDPRAFIRQALALLRPGGSFYLQTPNFSSLMHQRYGADWYALETPRHLCLLTVPAMRTLLQDACPWASLTVRSNARRARREQEQTIAMRRSGSFESTVTLSGGERSSVAVWGLAERIGNRLLHWGEEIEVVGIKG